MQVISRSAPSGQNVRTGMPISLMLASRIEAGFPEPSTVKVLPAPLSSRMSKFFPVKVGVVNAGHLPLGAFRPERPHGDAHFFDVGVEDRSRVPGAVHGEGFAGAVVG